MDSESLLATLTLLRRGREDLASRFISRDVELVGDMFRFERSPALMALAIDRLNVSWITRHFELFDELDGAASDGTEEAFRRCVLALIERLGKGREDDSSAQWGLVKRLLDEKSAQLQAQIDFSNKDDLNYQRLVFSKHREAALFERIFAQAMRD